MARRVEASTGEPFQVTEPESAASTPMTMRSGGLARSVGTDEADDLAGIQ